MGINPGRIEYDVFLSHRGPDVKKGFVDYLYESLQAAGVPSFVDCKELKVGEKSWDAIVSAIRHSKIHIAVFSPGYAESKWCLDELCEMLECKTNGSSTLFLPLFYNVAPSALRSPISENSCYFASFAEHHLNPNIKDSDIQGWKSALDQASLITGFTLDKDAHGSESYLMKLTEKKILDVLNNTLLLAVAKHPVGVREQLEKALDLMRLDDKVTGSAARTLGIFGMGGVGKSTLAKSIYNEIHRDFERASFMENVRSEAKNPNGLRGMQERMLRGLLKKDNISVDNAARGKEMIKWRLEGFKILIILDDVDEREQLEALLPPLDCLLHLGSRIVITTRDEEIVNLAHAHERIYMQGLSDPHAHTLFNLHAFLQKEPPARAELESLSKKVVAACQGLPLALEVLGAHLYNKDVSVWEETVKVLQSQRRNMGLPAQREVTKCLRISYDALDSVEEKPMFLDVACFLLGEREDRAKRIWGESPTAGLCLENLRLKCLVKVDQDRRLTMHDLLRDMGREIVAESHRNIWQRSHLWNEMDVRSVLKRKNGTCDVRGLGLILNSDEKWDTRSFAGMSGLQLLKLSNGHLTGDFACISKELRWFQWRSCPLESVPSELGLENVAVVDLMGSSILSFSSEHMSETVKELNLSECSNLKHLPEFIIDSTSSGLELLDLGGCVNLESIPDSVGRFSPSLRYINISNCGKLTTLPEGITHLPSLTTLLMNKCSGITKLPDAIGRLTALKEIGLEETSLRSLPQSFGNLSNLVLLHLHECFQLTELPSTIGDLSSLVSFHLNACSQLMEFPSTIGKLKKLTSFSIKSCPLISEIPQEASNLTNLVDLQIRDCKSMSKLPDNIGNLKKLRDFSLHSNGKLSFLPESISQLEALVSLDMGRCDISDGGLPNEYSTLSSLQRMDLQYNPHLSRLPEHFHQLPKLQSLAVHHCGNLREVPCLPPTLQELDMGDCPRLPTIPYLSSLKELQNLVLCNCIGLKELIGLEHLCHLFKLNISGCTSLVNTSGLEKLTSLRFLYLAGSGVSLLQDSKPWIEKAVSNLELVSLYGDEIPDVFPNCDTETRQVQQQEHANECCMEIVLQDVDTACKGVLFCFVSHDQGWSDYPWDHGRYSSSYTYADAEVVERGGRTKLSQSLFVNRHADQRTQLHISIFRASHPFVASLKSGDTIRVFARSLYQAWRITVSKAAVKLIYEEDEMEKGLQELSRQVVESTNISCVHCGKLQCMPDFMGSSSSSDHTSKSLKELNLSERPDLKDLSEINDCLSGLETLNLAGCVNLERIPVCRFSPSLLRYLNISSCRKLKTLPEGITHLRSLTTLLMRNCRGIIKLPDAIGELTALEMIGLEGTSLMILPQSFGKLSNLVSLHLSHCSQLIDLPSSIGGLSSLVSLRLQTCYQLRELPSTIGNLKNLTSFNITSCPLISEIPQEASNLTNLVDLQIFCCPSMYRLPDNIGNLTNLVTLQICDCESMCKLPDSIGNLKQLADFSLSFNGKLSSLPSSITQLETLVSLEMGYCDITDGGLPNEFATLSSLQKIELMHNPHLSRLPEKFHHLPMLQSLALNHCINLSVVSCLPPTLKVLDMGDCPGLTTIPCLPSLKELEDLVLCNCTGLRELIGLECLCNLSKLNITGCTSLVNTPGMEKLPLLKFLYLAGSGVSLSQASQSWIENMVSLELFSLYGDQIPDCSFLDCKKKIEMVQHKEDANELCMEVVVPEATPEVADTACKAVLFCFVSHDQGSSNYQWEHGRYSEKYTYVEAEVVERGGCSKKISQTLLINRHADERNQLHVSIFRASHPFVASLKGGDTIRVFARTLNREWAITVIEGAVKVIYAEDKTVEALQELSRQVVL